MNNFKHQYLKYKKKYLILRDKLNNKSTKQQLGGNLEDIKCHYIEGAIYCSTSKSKKVLDGDGVNKCTNVTTAEYNSKYNNENDFDYYLVKKEGPEYKVQSINKGNIDESLPLKYCDNETFVLLP